MNNTKLLLIRFKNFIGPEDIESLRGAIINELCDKDILFHNHLPEDGGYRCFIISYHYLFH